MQQETLVTFNKQIEISVSVDTIAQRLYETMDKSNPHAALIVNNIIGYAMDTNTLGPIYNALHGWQDKLNITKGKDYWMSPKSLSKYEADEKWLEQERVTVTVIDINEYTTSTRKVQVEYNYINKQSIIKTTTALVEAADLIEPIEPVLLNIDTEAKNW